MAVNTVYPTGYVDILQFERITNEFFIYHSPLQHRDYELNIINGAWKCNCPDARYISHKQCKQCKHERALTQLWERHQERKSLSMQQAEEAAARATREAEQHEQITALAFEIGKVRKEWKKADLQTAEALSKFALETNEQLRAMREEIKTLKAENSELKRVLATKATARRKHQSETEAAQIKEQINTALDDATEQAEAAINAVKMARAELADLEAIPYALKAELDSWTASGKEELQPDYQAPDWTPPEVKKALRDAQGHERARRTASPEERRKMAPLNGNQGFSLLKQ